MDATGWTVLLSAGPSVVASDEVHLMTVQASAAEFHRPPTEGITTIETTLDRRNPRSGSSTYFHHP